MPAFGEWTTYEGIRQSEGVNPAKYPPGYGGNPTKGAAAGWRAIWRATQSFAAYGAGQFPENSLAARMCCLTHASEAENGGEGSWDPGECTALSSPNAVPSAGVFSDLRVGVGSSWLHRGFLLASSYDVNALHARVWVEWDPLWLGLGLPPYGDAREVHGRVLMQIPGWFEAASVGLFPEVEIIRVDAEASITTVGVSQSGLTNPTTVRMHDSSGGGGGATPYSAMGAVVASASTGGGTSAVITVPDIQIGESRYWDLSSAWVAAGNDPGQFESNYAGVAFQWDFIWTVRARFRIDEVIDVCRWLQRDDGLGVTAAGRARTGTSLQRGKRFRGYR